MTRFRVAILIIAAALAVFGWLIDSPSSTSSSGSSAASRDVY